MREIPGFAGYFASEDGAILSAKDGLRVLSQREVDGYMFVTVTVYLNGKRERRRHAVHRLVSLAFNGLPPVGLDHTRHLNGVRSDNRAANLAWGTPLENARDAMHHGTLGKGMKARRRKLTEDQVREIRDRLFNGEPDAALAAEFGVSRQYPTHLAAGRNWSHVS